MSNVERKKVTKVTCFDSKKYLKQIGTLINLKDYNPITLETNYLEYSGSARHLAL